MRIGIGHDTHRLVEGRPLKLGGVSVPHSHGLLGHSDADVVLHAVSDALLGAVALGDIGELYPDTSSECQGINSAEILEAVFSRIMGLGWRLGNVDLVIQAQTPKLSQHKCAIRRRIAEMLQLDVGDVSVKAKTGEGVGPVGRGEVIGCLAVVLLEKSSS